MLQKHKSKTIAKFKFLLVVPVLAMMLIYVACSDENSSKDIEVSELGQYTYVIEKGEAQNRTVESLAIQEKSEEFIKNNNDDYVLWATFNHSNGSATYTVHSAEENVPKEYSKHEVSEKNGSSYTMYMNLKSDSKEGKTKYSALDEVLLTDEVSFGEIEEVPTFDSCLDIENAEERNSCTSNKIMRIVLGAFKTEIGKKIVNKGELVRIIVQFKIDENGNINSIKTRSKYPELGEEAKRVVSLIPKMIPGKQNGKPVGVVYSLPIVFQN